MHSSSVYGFTVIEFQFTWSQPFKYKKKSEKISERTEGEETELWAKQQQHQQQNDHIL